MKKIFIVLFALFYSYFYISCQKATDSSKFEYEEYLDGTVLTLTITKYLGSSKSVTVPNLIKNIPVTVIGAGAFYECYNIEKINLPNSITIIESDAFAYCENLKEINMKNGIIEINSGAFNGCMSLKTISIPATVTYISWLYGGIFNGCLNMMNIQVDSSNENYNSINGVLYDKIGKKIISYPKGKKGDYSIPNGITEIMDYTFSYCTGLTSVKIPESVIKIGYRAFEYCESLVSIQFPYKMQEIKDYAFIHCENINSITMPVDLEKLGKGVFLYCSSLGEFIQEYSTGNYEVKNSVLFDKKNEELITCPATINGIFNVPEHIKIIGYNAFLDCKNITAINIPSSVTDIGYSISDRSSDPAGAFSGCNNLASINVDPNNNTYISIDGLLYSNFELLFCPIKKNGDIQVPTFVKSIRAKAFANCENVNSIYLPDSITEIAGNVFENCTNLREINIPLKINFLLSGIFFGCTNLNIETKNQLINRFGERIFNK
jgi:hypothetical protein